jgi:hypothetical protein
MARYASNTKVSSEKSRNEIERTLQRYGASGFGFWIEDDKALVQFQIEKLKIAFKLPMPDRKSEEFTMSSHENDWQRKPLAAETAHRRWEQSCRQRWRALALVIKAKLEAIDSGISTFEEEFMAHIMLPDGVTVGEKLVPGLTVLKETGDMPKLLVGKV